MPIVIPSRSVRLDARTLVQVLGSEIAQRAADHVRLGTNSASVLPSAERSMTDSMRSPAGTEVA